MKTTLRFLSVAALAAIALAAAFVPEAHAAVQHAIAFVGPDNLAALSLAGSVATTVTRDKAYTGQIPVRTQPENAERYEIVIPIAFPAAAPVANDTHALCKLLPGVQVIDYDLFLDDLDAGGSAAASLELGELKADLSDIAVSYKAGLTIGQTGGLVRHAATSEAADLRTITAATLTNERVIGLKWTTAAATYTPNKTGLLVLKVIG